MKKTNSARPQAPAILGQCLAMLLVAVTAPPAIAASTESKPPLERKGTRSESIEAGKPVNIGKQRRMQLPAEPEFYFIDKLGKQVIPYLIYDANEFHEGLAAILIADQWGFINKAGDVQIGADFDLTGDFSEGLAAVKVKDKWGYVDHEGKFVIEPRFVAAEAFKNGYAAVQLGKDSPEFPQKANDVLQSILKDPNMPPLKKAWLAIAGSRAAGIIDKQGKFVTDCYYSSIQNFSEDKCLAKEGTSVVFLNKQGQIVLRPECSDAKSFSEGLAAVKVKDKWGFINATGSLVIKPIFDEVDEFHNGLCSASVNKKWGFINKKGKWEIDPKYDVILEGFQNGVAIVGKDMCPIQNTHADVTRTSSGFLVARRTGNTRDFDESTTALEPGYFAYPDYRFNLVERDGKQTIGKQFDQIGALSDGLRIIRLDGKFGYSDNTGNVFLEPKYKVAEPFSDGMALVKDGATKPRLLERNEILLRHSVPAMVNDPDLIRKDIEVCSEVIRLDPTNAQAFRDRGYLLCALSRFNDSLSDFQQVTRLCSSSSEGYYWRGMAHMQLSGFAEAAVDFTSAIEMEPSKPQNLMGRALALKALKRPELALQDINRAILQQDHPYYHRIRGQIYEDLGQTTDAIVDMQIGRRAPVLEPWPVGPQTQEEIVYQAAALHKKLQAARENPTAHAKIALLASEQADALEELRRLKNREEKVLELEDVCVRALELRREALKNAQAATKDGAQVGACKSDLANAIAHLSAYYVRAGDFDKAKPLCEESISLAREIEAPIKEADFMLDLGKLYAAQKDYEKAEEFLRKSLELTKNPTDTPSRIVRGQILNNYALVLMHIDRKNEAATAMNEASDLLNFGSDLTFLSSPPPLPENASSEESYELALQCRSLGLIETSRSYMKQALERSKTAESKARAERFLTSYVPKQTIDLKLTKAFQKGRTSELTGDFPTAEKFYKACTETESDFEWPHEALARLKRLQNELPAGEKHAKKAVSVNPNYVEGWLELARINKAQGDDAKARQSVLKALSIDPDSQLAKFEQKRLDAH
jgi:tetratricopeptide (TPR) repeat protein